MKNNHPTFTRLAAALLAGLACAPLQASAEKASAEDRVEVRIASLHSQIHITPDQESQWAKVAKVMRENAQAQDALVQKRLDKAGQLTAVEDMKSYAEIAAAHAEGAQKLIPVFEALYDGLPPAQQKEADEAFRHGDKQHHHDHGKAGRSQ